jgi:hypothetical protein
VSNEGDCVSLDDPPTSHSTRVKWIVCPGCDAGQVVQDLARSCSPKCRNRVWRRRHGVGGRREAFCAWCRAPLIYLPQDKLPGVRRYCDHGCARQAWLFQRAKERTTVSKALEIAIRRLQNSRMPIVLAAAVVLAQLRDDVNEREDVERGARVRAFLSKLPPTG